MSTSPAINAAAGLAAAIVSAAFALSVWEIGSRTVARLVGDVVDGTRRRSSLLRGLTRAIVGAIFAVLSIALVVHTMPPTMLRVQPLVATAIFIVGLLVEGLIGDVLRAAVGVKHYAPQKEQEPRR